MAGIPPNVQGLQQLLGRLEGAEANLRNLTRVVEEGNGPGATQQDMRQLMNLVQNLHNIQSQLGDLQGVVNNVPTMDVNALLASVQEEEEQQQNQGVEIQEIDDDDDDNYDGDNHGDEKMTMKLDFLIRTKEQCESRMTPAKFARRVSPIVRL